MMTDIKGIAKEFGYDVSSNDVGMVEDIIKMIEKEGMVDISTINPDATIESVGMASVDVVMVLTAIEEKYDIYLPIDGELSECKTVKSLVDVLVIKIKEELNKKGV
jgi:acyl carrier protein